MGLSPPSCSFLVSLTLSELSSLGSDLELLVSCVEGGLEDLLWFLLLPLQGEEVQEGGVSWVEQCSLLHSSHPGLGLGCSARTRTRIKLFRHLMKEENISRKYLENIEG